MINFLVITLLFFSCLGIPFLLLTLVVWGVGIVFWEKQFKVTLGSFIFTAVILLMPILGYFTGSLLISIIMPTHRITNEDWVLLPKSSQGISGLRAADFYIIYAETTDGNLVSCYYQTADDYDCWREVAQIPEINKGDVCFGFPEQPAGVDVIDKIQFENCIVFASVEDINVSSYVLSDDGQVYRSSYGVGSLSPSKAGWLNIFRITGLLVGLISTFGIIAVNKRKNMFTAISD